MATLTHSQVSYKPMLLTKLHEIFTRKDGSGVISLFFASFCYLQILPQIIELKISAVSQRIVVLAQRIAMVVVVICQAAVMIAIALVEENAREDFGRTHVITSFQHWCIAYWLIMLTFTNILFLSLSTLNILREADSVPCCFLTIILYIFLSTLLSIIFQCFPERTEIVKHVCYAKYIEIIIEILKMQTEKKDYFSTHIKKAGLLEVENYC